MSSTGAVRVLALAGIIHLACGLLGDNLCYEEQDYTMTTRVKYQQPVLIKTYTWCLSIPPRCSSVRTEMRENWKVQTVVRTKSTEVCCESFKQVGDRCVPVCPDGLVGENCDKDCPEGRWGPSCYRECRCPENSQCDSKNGKCICLDGWIGSSCDMRKILLTTPIRIVGSSSRVTKPLFDWSTIVTIPITQQPKIPSTPTTKQPFIDSNTMSTSATTPTTNKIINDKVVKQIKIVEDNHTTEQPHTTFRSIQDTTKESTTPLSVSTTPQVMILPTEIFTEVTSETTDAKTIAINVVTVDRTTQNSTEYPTSEKTENSFEPNVPVQIESPDVIEVSPVTESPSVPTKQYVNVTETTESPTESIGSFPLPKTTVSTAKRKQSKIYKVESDILKITLHSAGETNETNSKIFKTVTLPTVNNTTRKLLSPKVKVYHESKMITIPVRIIMDSGKIQPNYGKKLSNGTTKNDVTTQRTSVILKKIKQASPMNVTDEPLEEIRHVLTEPEQITSVAGRDDSDDKRDDLFSVLSVAGGVAVAIILTTCVIALVARCREVRAERRKQMEMHHVRSMINVSEDEMSTGYLRNVFHSPLSEVTSLQAAEDKIRFSVPFMQPVIIHAISPNMIENFRDILECHYDHPKPPRPTTTSFAVPKSHVYDLPPSRYSNVDILPRISEDSNQSSPNDDKTEFCLPVTDAAINVLKLEHGNVQQHHALNMENLEPVYDEIPCWDPAPPCANRANQLRTFGHEAVTEL